MTRKVAGSGFGPFANWKDETQYPDSESTDIEQLVWEFIRRNPVYQADWQLEHNFYPKHARKGEIIPAMNQHGIDPDVAIYTMHTKKGRLYYLNQYGLQYLVNPEIASPNLFFLDLAFKQGRIVSPHRYGDFENNLPDNF